ncbi:MAG: hypothetical protein WCP67_04520 [Verrucomicrobiota bacterium]|jgi:hypothetical protein
MAHLLLIFRTSLMPIARSIARPGNVSRRVLSLLGGVILFVVLAAALAIWSVGRCAPSLLDSTLSSKSGAHLIVQNNDTNLFVGRVNFTDFTITNPSRWTDARFLKGKRLRLELDPATFIGDSRRVIHLLELDIDELTLVGKEDYLKDNNAQDIFRGLKSADTPPPPAGQPVVEVPRTPFLIEKLRLRIGHITVLAADGTPLRRVVIDRQFDLVFEAQNITDVNLAQTLTDPLGKQVVAQTPAATAGLLFDLSKDKIRTSITEKLLNEK